MQRREFALELVCEGEIEYRRFLGFAMAEDGLGFARIVVAVVIEENDFAAHFLLQPPGRLDFGGQKTFREKPARLLAKTNDGCVLMNLETLGGFWLRHHCLKEQAEKHARRAADERIPEIRNVS